MESYSKPEVKETLANNGKIYESSGNISVSSKKFINSSETDNVDLSVLGGSNPDSSQKETLNDNYNSSELKIDPDANIAQITETIINANDLTKAILLAGAGTVTGPLIVYDSFHGKENEPASDFIDDFLFDRFSKYLSKSIELNKLIMKDF